MEKSILAKPIFKRRFWDKVHDDLVRENYRTKGVEWCADQTQRTPRSIYARAHFLGLTNKQAWLPDSVVIAAIAKHHPSGLSDPEIVDALLKQTGTIVDRHRVGCLRKGMGLASNALSDHRRRQVAAKTRQQLQDAGLTSMAELRLRKFNEWKRGLGWPETLTVRAVQSLELFYRHGVLTRVQLCELLGVSSKRRISPASNAPGGTVLAELQRAGLISRCRKAIPIASSVVLHQDPYRSRPGPDKRRPKTKCIDFYFLNPGVEPNGAGKHNAVS